MNCYLERKIIGLLNQIETLSSENQNQSEDKNERERIIDQIDKILSSKISTFSKDFSLETLAKIPETILSFPSKMHIAEKYLKSFLRNVDCEGLFSIKIHVLYAQLLSQKANKIELRSELKIQLIRDAINHLNKAIKTITHEKSRKKYSFMVYNISKVIYQMVRMYFRPGHLKEFTEMVNVVNQTLASQVEDEYDWNGFFTWLLFYCLEDSKLQKNEATQILEKLWENSKQNNYFFHEALFRLRMSNSAGTSQVWLAISKEAEKDPTGELKVIFSLQSIHNRVTPENQIEKELNSLMRSLLPTKNEESTKTMSNSTNDLLTEIAHTAAKNGITSVAANILEFLKKKQQLSSKAYILIEFTKAELKIKTKFESMTVYKDNNEQSLKRDFEVGQRKEALQIITKAIKARIVFLNPLFLYEGCVKIWNFSLPFLNEKYQTEVFKSFVIAAKVLEEIQSCDFHLRTWFHYELAKVYLENGSIQAAEEQAKKCQRLFNFCENNFDHKKVTRLLDQINSVIKPLEQGSRTLLDSVQDKLNLIQSGNVEDISSILAQIQRDLFEYNLDCIEAVENLIPKNKIISQAELNKMSQSELTISQNELLKQAFYKSFLKKSSLYEEACKLSFEKNLNEQCVLFCNDFLCEISKFKEPKNEPTKIEPVSPQVHLPQMSEITFDPFNDQEIQICQIKILFIKAQSIIKKITDDGVEFAMSELMFINSTQTSAKHSAEVYFEMKNEIISSFIIGAEIALKLKQTWLIFNAGIIIWNTYLTVFKNVQNNRNLHPNTINLLDCYFNALKSVISLIEQRKITDYDFENKIQVYGNISIIFTRILEQNGDYAKVYSITEDMLLVSLSHQTRKIFNSIRARVGVLLKPDKTGKKTTASLTNQTDQSIFEINSKLEIISNHFNTNVRQDDRQQAIKDCYELLVSFHDKKKNDLDAELLCELWTKLANLALNEEKIEFTKLALSSLEKALEKSKDQGITGISKYVALAKFLYAKGLCHMVETNGIVKEKHELILLKSLQMILESIDICIKMKNSKIFEQIKKFYLIIKTISELFYTPENRRCIIKPIFSLVYYIKIAKEMFDNFIKDIELSQILINMCIYVTRGCIDKEDWELALMVSNILIEICHTSLKDRIWILKVISLTKKGIEIEVIFEEIKNCSVNLQCTLLQEIAWNADSVQGQYQAFSRAIDIVKKENSPKIFEVILNFKEWMFRNDFPIENIKQSLVFLEKLVHKKSFEKNSMTDVGVQPNKVFEFRNSSLEKLELQNKEVNSTGKVLSENEVINYFSSGKSSFHDSLTNYCLVKYSIEDCDNLFKVYYISSLLEPNLEQKMAYISNSVFFIWKIFYLIFEQIQRSRSHEKSEKELSEEETQCAILISMPQTWETWLNFQISKSFLESLSKTNIKYRFGCDSFKQPLVTFHYLIMIMESLVDFGNLNQMAIIVKFAGLFSVEIIENDLAFQLSNLWSAQLYYSASKNDKSKAYVNEFIKAVPLTQEYFNREIQQFSNTYSDAFSKNFQLNSITTKVKKSHFLNMFYSFEFWAIFAEILYNIGELELVKIIIPQTMKCCDKASSYELLGKCQVIMGSILSKEGEVRIARSLFEQAGKNLKLLKNWKLFLLHSTNHFIENKDLVNPWKIVEKFENLIEVILPKDCSKYIRLDGNDVLAFIQLIKARLHLEEFRLFQKNFIIEKEEYYCDNFVKVISETLTLIRSFSKNPHNNVLLNNFTYVLGVFKKLIHLISSVKLLNYDILNQSYIVCSLLFLLFENLMTPFVSKNNSIQKNNNTYTNETGHQIEPSNLQSFGEDEQNLSAFLVNDLLFLRIQTVNLFLGLETIYRSNGYTFPSVKEKYFKEKYFGVSQKLQLLTDFENSDENVADDYVDVFEYKLNQNIRRSWALIRSNLLEFKRIKNHEETSEKAFKDLTRLEFEKTLAFKSEFWRNLDLRKSKIIGNFENVPKNNINNFDQSELINEIQESEESEYDINVKNYDHFITDDFFKFNKERTLKKLIKIKKSKNKRIFETLAEYQGFVAQECLRDFYFDRIDKKNSLKTKIEICIEKKDRSEFKTLVDQNRHLQLLFRHRTLEGNVSLLPKNSLFLIIEPGPNFTDLFCGFLYNGDDESCNAYHYFIPKNGSSILMSIKQFLKKYELEFNKCETDDSNNLSVIERMLSEVNIISQAFGEIIVEFDIFTKLVIEMRQTDQSIKTKNVDRKKTNDEHIKKLNGLFFLSNVNLIQLCFDRIFDQCLENFSFVSKDLSLHNLICKLQNSQNSKPVSINCNEGFYMLSDLANPNKQQELVGMNKIIKLIFQEGFDYEERYVPDVSELQNQIGKKKAILFNGCSHFTNAFKSNNVLSVAGSSKVELFICFEKLRILDPSVKQTNKRNQQFSNYIEFRNLVLTLSILNVKFSIVPNGMVFDKSAVKLLNILQTKIETDGDLSTLFANTEFYKEFSFLGYPGVQLQKDLKKVGK